MTAAMWLLAAAPSSFGGDSLQWGTPSSIATQSRRLPTKKVADSMFRDPMVVAANWEEDSANQVLDPLYLAQRRSVVVKRSSELDPPEVEPIEASTANERLANLPEDPFENSSSVSGLEQFEEGDPRQLLDAAEDDLEQEMQRRGSIPDPSTSEQYDLFEDPANLKNETFQESTSNTDELSIDEQLMIDLFEGASDEVRDELEEQTDLFEESANESEQPLEPQDAEVDLFEAQMPEPAEEEIDYNKAPREPSYDWDPTREVTPTPEEEESDLFDKMTQGDLDLEGRYDFSSQRPDEDSTYEEDSWRDFELLQPSDEELSELQRKVLEEERAKTAESCQEEVEKLRSQRLENIDLSIRIEGNAGEDFPFECTLEDKPATPRQWPQITYMWKASGLCHKPLYFEQVHLERYGHSWGPIAQPLLSGVHFFGTVPILPYKMGLKTPNECVYALGHYRPGDCAPYMIDALPFTWRAAAYQGAVTTGLVFLVP